MRLLFLTLLSVLSIGAASAEFTYIEPVAAPSPADSTDLPRLEHKAFWRASAEVVGLNLALGTFDRYVLKGDFAYISMRTIRDNFR